MLNKLVPPIRIFLILCSMSALGYAEPLPVDGADSSTFQKVASNPEQRFNLYGATDVGGVRYSSTLVWPKEIGQADLCLWNDDKFVAFSVTIDDNTQPDHSWWLEMADKYDLKLTWMVVTGGISGSNSYNGTWEGFQELVNAGHSVQSHTVSHGQVSTDEEYITDYSQSQIDINTNLSGQMALTMAYPDPSGVPIRPELAKDYYIGVRGVTGTPNKATSINYFDTNSTSSRINADYVDSVMYGTSGTSWLGDSRYLRGWLCTHFHLVKDRASTEVDLQYIDTLKSQIWHAHFSEVIRFVQERDTAQLRVTSVEEEEIHFELTDWMDDSIYDYPLTVKFRIDNEWDKEGISAIQGGKALEAWTVENDGNLYALVKAVPDRGEVVLYSSELDTEALSWGGMIGDAGGDLDTGDLLGWINVKRQPWIWSYTLDHWIYAADPGEEVDAVWSYIPKPGM